MRGYITSHPVDTMASFAQLSSKFFTIIRSEKTADGDKTQVIILPAIRIRDISDALQKSIDLALDRLADPTLPPTEIRVGEKIYIKISVSPNSGSIRIDIREWFTDAVTGLLRPTTSGVNLKIEQAAAVHAEINTFLTKEKEAIARLVAIATESSPAIKLPTIEPIKRKIKAKTAATPPQKKKKAGDLKKEPKKQKSGESEEDASTFILSPSEDEESD